VRLTLTLGMVTRPCMNKSWPLTICFWPVAGNRGRAANNAIMVGGEMAAVSPLFLYD